VRISCVVHNTGDRAGDEVVQLYVRDPVATVARPRLELKGFGRIGLLPGEKRTVTFRLPVESLAFHNVDMRRVAEAGAFEVMVGSSSEDIRLRGEFRLGATRDVRRRRFETEVSVQAD